MHALIKLHASALSMTDQLTHYYNVERMSPYVDDIHNGS